MRTLTVKVPEMLDNQLTAAARNHGLSRSEAIRQAIEAWTRSQVVSAGDLAADLCGCAQGPADLSTNPAHLDGYGT